MEAEQTLPPAPLQITTVQPKLAVIQEARFAQNSPGTVTVDYFYAQYKLVLWIFIIINLSKFAF